MSLAFPETKYRPDTEEVVDLAPARDEGGSEVEPEEGIVVEKKVAQTSGSDTRRTDSLVNRGYPSSSQRWKVLSKPDIDAIRLLPRDIVMPFYLALFPIVLFGALCVTFGANSLLVLNLVESQGFSRPPYNFSPEAVGFTNFALMVGGIIGLCTAGPLSDWMSMVLTKRNNGIREPEMRLFTFIPYIVIGVIGMSVSLIFHIFIKVLATQHNRY